MKRSRFTTEQVIGILKEHEGGAKTAELARRHSVTEHTIYRWKAKYGGMDVSDAQRLKQLEDENRRLKHTRKRSAERAGGRSGLLILERNRVTDMGGEVPAGRTAARGTPGASASSARPCG